MIAAAELQQTDQGHRGKQDTPQQTADLHQGVQRIRKKARIIQWTTNEYRYSKAQIDPARLWIDLHLVRFRTQVDVATRGQRDDLRAQQVHATCCDALGQLEIIRHAIDLHPFLAVERFGDTREDAADISETLISHSALAHHLTRMTIKATGNSCNRVSLAGQGDIYGPLALEDIEVGKILEQLANLHIGRAQ